MFKPLVKSWKKALAVCIKSCFNINRIYVRIGGMHMEPVFFHIDVKVLGLYIQNITEHSFQTALNVVDVGSDVGNGAQFYWLIEIFGE